MTGGALRVGRQLPSASRRVPCGAERKLIGHFPLTVAEQRLCVPKHAALLSRRSEASRIRRWWGRCPSAARPSGETGRPAAPERRCVIFASPIRLYIRVPGVFAWRSCSSGRRNRAGNANRNLGPIKNEPQTDASLGEVVAGDVGERVVELGNSVDAVLHVSKVRACCGASAVLEMAVDNPRRPRVGGAYLSQRSCGDRPHPVSLPGRKASVSEARLRLSAVSI